MSQQTGQDWKPQVFNFGPRPGSSGGRPAKTTESQASRVVQQGGKVDISKKQTTGNAHAGLGAAAKRLDDDHESTKHKTVDFNVRVNIQRARQAKNWTQSDLAKNINEKPSVVGDYEQGRAIPNESVLQRMEKALGIHLRGKNAGQPMAPKTFKSKPAQ